MCTIVTFAKVNPTWTDMIYNQIVLSYLCLPIPSLPLIIHYLINLKYSLLAIINTQHYTFNTNIIQNKYYINYIINIAKFCLTYTMPDIRFELIA